MSAFYRLGTDQLCLVKDINLSSCSTADVDGSSSPAESLRSGVDERGSVAGASSNLPHVAPLAFVTAIWLKSVTESINELKAVVVCARSLCCFRSHANGEFWGRAIQIPSPSNKHGDEEACKQPPNAPATRNAQVTALISKGIPEGLLQEGGTARELTNKHVRIPLNVASGLARKTCSFGGEGTINLSFCSSTASVFLPGAVSLFPVVCKE